DLADKAKAQFGASSEEYLRALNRLGGIYMRLSDYQRAEEVLLQARTVHQSMASPAEPFGQIATGNLAKVYRAVARLRDAEGLFRTALKSCEQYWGRHWQVARCETDLANLLREVGKYDEAEQLLRDALSLVQPASSAPDVAFRVDVYRADALNNVA